MKKQILVGILGVSLVAFIAIPAFAEKDKAKDADLVKEKEVTRYHNLYDGSGAQTGRRGEKYKIDFYVCANCFETLRDGTDFKCRKGMRCSVVGVGDGTCTGKMADQEGVRQCLCKVESKMK